MRKKMRKACKMLKMQVDNSVKNLADSADLDDLDADLERLVNRLVNKHPELKNKSFGGVALLHTARIVKRRRVHKELSKDNNKNVSQNKQKSQVTKVKSNDFERTM